MPTDHRAALADTKTFPQLIAYLRDEMGWPIGKEDFEELTFEYRAEELGIESKAAANIQEIKRLRPLSVNQPWGVFFVKFEPKRLPVVALRRLLGAVVRQQRATVGAAERPLWDAEDLLFVSNYGEKDERQITFAHFSQSAEKGDLPTLKVLGWNNLDTSLHLDAVATELTTHLSWPSDENDAGAWRRGWQAAFTVGHREVITTSKELSIRLAKLAGDIRDRIKSALAIETDRGPLTKLMKAFQTSLVHDLDADGFADMYAQTIAYGLLSARIVDPHKKSVDDFAGHMRTNPFLRELMETFLKVGGRRGKAGGPGIDFDELGVSEVVQLLDDANMEAVVLDFGDKNPQEDPVIHFYELFLKEYDAKKRMQRGVFYTPRPVVSYIVRSVDELLRTEFGLEDGLADTTTWGEMAKRHNNIRSPEGTSPEQAFVQILDPATGTGTFLVEVIDIIHKTMAEKWKRLGHGEKKSATLWNEYVPEHLLTRLHAYELLMAPYAIAHLKVGLKLYETGYRFGSDERARIYLTNALEPAQDFSGTFDFAIPALAHEAEAVNEIKRQKRVTVVIGNPPYSNFGQLNKSPFILGLLEDYKRELDEKKINLDDDFIKFVRFSQHLLDRSGVGVLGYITNNVYADGVTHRRMRESLMETFDAIRFLDLHGSSKRQEQAPGGAKDENVFDITIGVGVGLFTRSLPGDKSRSVTHGELWGERLAKYAALLNASVAPTQWAKLSATTPHFFFVPKDFDQLAEYKRGIPVQEMFPLSSSGIQTKRDNVAIAETKQTLLTTLGDFSRLPAKELRSRYDLPDDGRDWRIEWASAHATEILKSPETVVPILYRPFDSRWTVMDSRSKGFVAYPRFDVMSQMVRRNLGLIVTRQLSLPTFQHVFVTRQLIDGNTISLQTREYNYLFPLHLRDEQASQRSISFDGHGKTNLGAAFLKTLASQLKTPIGSNGLPAGLTPEDIFHYAYTVLHSPGYRSRYAEFLKIDFPRVPLTGNLQLFHALVGLGHELVALHLMESPKLDHSITVYTGPKDSEVGRVGWSDDTVWLNAAATKKGQPVTPGTIGFRGVPEAVWNFHIGGYRVCEKWLKDRRGRTLPKDDIAHYQKIVVALNETIRLMKEIDVVIEQHGGWPGAFQTDEAAQVDAASVVREAEVIPLFPETATREYTFEPVPLRKVAQPHHVDLNDLEREELMCRIRQMFSDGKERDRESAIDELARDFGYQRTETRIREELDNAMRTAVRRGIVYSASQAIKIDVRKIEDYDRGILKDLFLASLQGKSWTEREDAIRGLARWLGFRRTGAAIDEVARSLINGLLREGRLESEGSSVRKV